MNRKTYTPEISVVFKMKDFSTHLKFISSHVHGKSRNLENDEDRGVVTTDHYQEVVCGLNDSTISDNLR